MTAVAKVTAFIHRPGPGAGELLLFRHPTGGIQLPAGTVEPGETPGGAAYREACEESGLPLAGPGRLLQSCETDLPPDRRVLTRAATAYAHPDPGSFDWIRLPRAVLVTPLRESRGYVQVEYREWDDIFAQNFATYHLVGWVPAAVLAGRLVRHFYLFTFHDPTPPEWEISVDQHVFRLFWASLDALPPLVSPQGRWLSVLADHLPFSSSDRLDRDRLCW